MPFLLILYEPDLLGTCLLLLLLGLTHLLLRALWLSAPVPLAQTPAGSPQPPLYNRRDISDPCDGRVLGNFVLGSMVPSNFQRLVERPSAPCPAFFVRRVLLEVFLTIVHTDFSTCPERCLRPLRNPILPLGSTSLHPPAVFDPPSGIVPGPRLHHQSHRRLLPLWLPRSQQWTQR